MNSTELIKHINSGKIDSTLRALYNDNVEHARKRYIKAIESYISIFGKTENLNIFSVAGRSELSGNHTDHNCGRVIAASIDLDIIAVASATNDNTISVKSEGFGMDIVNINEYSCPQEKLFGTSNSLVAGVCAGFKNNGLNVGGFNAYTTSNVLKGSGLSSSAAFEDMIGTILNHFYNGGSINSIDIAKISQYSENVFFGKPCGLMDQIACAFGGIVAIDFKNPSEPIVEKLSFDLTSLGYSLCIVNTGGNHADLTEDYASVPKEMKEIAAYFNKSCLRQVDEEDFIDKIAELRAELGDREILRAIHFFEENKRVSNQVNALRENKLDEFLSEVISSGKSSFCYLQNVYTNKNIAEQGLSLALALSEKKLFDKRAAWRIHGGGFAGTIQAFLPKDHAADFCEYMNNFFGENSSTILKIRLLGACKVV